jgi:hypothetical protein
MRTTKTCRKCGQEKPLDQFYRASNKDGYRSSCKACDLELRQTPEKAARWRVVNARWRTSNPERFTYLRRRSALKRLYGITPEQYDQILADQGGVCAICKQPPTNRRLYVDHDHMCCPGKKSCGKCLRGLLCAACNAKLGWLENRWPEICNYVWGRLVAAA